MSLNLEVFLRLSLESKLEYLETNEEYLTKYNWQELAEDLSRDFMDSYYDAVEGGDSFDGLDIGDTHEREVIFNRFFDKFNWDNLEIYYLLSEGFVEKNYDKLNKSYIVYTQASSKFLLKKIDSLDIEEVLLNSIFVDNHFIEGVSDTLTKEEWAIVLLSPSGYVDFKEIMKKYYRRFPIKAIVDFKAHYEMDEELEVLLCEY